MWEPAKKNSSIKVKGQGLIKPMNYNVGQVDKKIKCIIADLVVDDSARRFCTER